MIVGWTPTARACAIECAAHIAADDPEAAVRWLDGLDHAVGRLIDFPHIGRVVPEMDKDDVREVLCGDYRVIYRAGDVIEVISVVHQRRPLRSADLEGE